MVETATTDVTYTVQRHTDRDGQPVQEGHPGLRPWTVLTERPQNGWTSRFVCVPGFRTEDDARRAVDGLRFEAAHTSDRVVGIDRDEYERRCAAAGVEAWTDERVWEAGYTLRYFDQPTINDDPTGRLPVAQWLHQRRANGIEAERERAMRAQRAAAASTAAEQLRRLPRCLRCDQPGTMAASLGPACPDHYDDLSD